jgi:hypothetical protein
MSTEMRIADTFFNQWNQVFRSNTDRYVLPAGLFLA